MNNNSSKVNPLTLFGFGGGLVILLGGLLSDLQAAKRIVGVD